jgi:hypothetical protein
MLGMRTSREWSKLLTSFMFGGPMVNLSVFDPGICGASNGKRSH